MNSEQSAVQELSPVRLAVVDSIAPHMRHNPYDSYTVLRAAGPFVPGPHETQLVTRHREAQAILQDPRWSHAEEPQLLHGESDVELPGSFLWMEPPEHTRYHRLVAKGFTPRVMAELAPVAGRVVGDLVDAALRRGGLDIMDDLAVPLAVAMVPVRLLGADPADGALFRAWQLAIARGTDPDSMLAQALDEMLRYDAPTQFTIRVALNDTVVGGREFRRGDGVVVLTASASRDDRVYPEADRFDITRYAGNRPARRHLGFSLGIHYCVGAPLARIEAEAALGALLDRAPELELATDTVAYRPSLIHRGIVSLPVTL